MSDELQVLDEKPKAKVEMPTGMISAVLFIGSLVFLVATLGLTLAALHLTIEIKETFVTLFHL